ncbi:hypothetical protein QYF36_013319 [Acer negundo]|nr:hypothetical protein QYF36_013319 [Acer negundo]
MVHALWGCSALKNVRTRYGLLQGFNYGSSISFQDYFFYCCQNLGKKDLELLYVILWRVWFLRNHLVHDGGHLVVDNVVSWSKEFFVEFLEANSSAIVQRDQVLQGDEETSRSFNDAHQFCNIGAGER